jgi:hypothetical protein
VEVSVPLCLKRHGRALDRVDFEEASDRDRCQIHAPVTGKPITAAEVTKFIEANLSLRK